VAEDEGKAADAKMVAPWPSRLAVFGGAVALGRQALLSLASGLCFLKALSCTNYQ